MKTSLFEVLDHLVKRSSSWSQFSPLCCTFIFMINHDQEPGTLLSQLWFQFFSCSHFYLTQSTPLISGSKFQIAAAGSTMLLIGVKVEGKVKKRFVVCSWSSRPDQRYSRSILQSLSFLCMWDDPPTIPIPSPSQTTPTSQELLQLLFFWPNLSNLSAKFSAQLTTTFWFVATDHLCLSETYLPF